MKLKPEDNQLSAEQQVHRHTAFNVWLSKAGNFIGYHRLPANVQYEVHGMLRRAFNAGTNYEARMAALEAQDGN